VQPFVIHAHFYQPERLNPWTGELDPEPTAAPDRDWNHRILRQCYRPNAGARIFDPAGRVERIVNNYERLSFNMGPTLLGWLERQDPRTYARVLDGDFRSTLRLGHGNAMAQAYNHMILPLANERDRRTQILWGLIDFRHRFGREAEGMWLPETACNPDVLDDLVDAGVAFTVLAPQQAAKVRYAGEEWQDAAGVLDTARPYRHAHSDGSGRSLAVFFYDGHLSQTLAFDMATVDAEVLLERVASARSGEDGLVNAALDGETFGHHHAFGELGLAYALFEAAQERGFEPTNYAAWLAAHPPTDDVEVHGGEGSAWSCSHGVGRWSRDCGCSTDAQPGWNQAWRTPLRSALDVVREAAAAAFTELGPELLRDPWAARDDYIRVRLGQLTATEYLDRHGRRDLTDARKVDLWSLLESQRHAMLMYTSCGWFFADVSGIETVYVLRYAARVLDLLSELGAKTPTQEVLDVLGEARSNKPGVGTGADVWRTQVDSAVVTGPRVAAHTTLCGLVRELPAREDAGGHSVRLVDHRAESRGRLRLSTAHTVVTSLATGRTHDLAVAALHLGGLDFHGVVAPYPGDEEYAHAADTLWGAFPTAGMATLIQLLGELFTGDTFGLEQALPEGRQEVVGAIFSDLTQRFAEQYARLYHDHQRILESLTAAGFDLPRDLRAAAQLTLSDRIEAELATAAAVPDDPAPFEAIRQILQLARDQGYALDITAVADHVTRAVNAAASQTARTFAPADLATVREWLQMARELDVTVDVSLAQEYAYEVATKARAGRLTPDQVDTVAALAELLSLAPWAWTSSSPS
jgi:alpha-amylase/alpha-mannosidase (GH57 family)